MAEQEIRANAVYTLVEVSEILKVSDGTLRRWIKSGKFRAPRVGRAYRFLGSQLLDALAADEAPSQPAKPRARR